MPKYRFGPVPKCILGHWVETQSRPVNVMVWPGPNLVLGTWSCALFSVLCLVLCLVLCSLSCALFSAFQFEPQDRFLVLFQKTRLMLLGSLSGVMCHVLHPGSSFCIGNSALLGLLIFCARISSPDLSPSGHLDFWHPVVW